MTTQLEKKVILKNDNSRMNITFEKHVEDMFGIENEKTFLRQYNPTNLKYMPHGKTSILNTIKRG